MAQQQWPVEPVKTVSQMTPTELRQQVSWGVFTALVLWSLTAALGVAVLSALVFALRVH